MFLEPDDFLFKIMSPDIVEGYILFPNKPSDFYFKIQNDEDMTEELFYVYLRPGYEEFLNYLKNNTETIFYTRYNNLFLNNLLENFDDKFNFIE